MMKSLPWILVAIAAVAWFVERDRRRRFVNALDQPAPPIGFVDPGAADLMPGGGYPFPQVTGVPIYQGSVPGSVWTPVNPML